jgi:hypothetical protein
MNQLNKNIITQHIKIGKIVKECNDHVMVEYNADKISSISDDMIEELYPILESGMNVDFIDNEGNFFSDNDNVIHIKIKF